jgi:hypothetical protein
MRQLRPPRQTDSADGRTRYECDFAVLLQDDPKQTTLANHIVDQVLSDRNPGFISRNVYFQSCSYSVHDLSRVQIDRNPPATPRFNMPFELGLGEA